MSNNPNFRFIFGPVRSSRLGLSLGLDLLGDRICSFDCIYCEVGQTTTKTIDRQAFVPAVDLLSELKRWLALGLPRPDHITLAGLGEPTLNTELGAIVDGVRALAPNIPVAVLTNSSLLGDPEVIKALNRCDVVLPSLDTLVEKEFLKLNRPCSGLSLQSITANLLAFRTQFPGRLYLEVLLVKGINDTPENQKRLRCFCADLAPHRVDVVTMTRPGAWSEAAAVDQETLTAWRQILGGSTESAPSSTKVDSRLASTSRAVDQDELTDRILASLRRRPQNVNDLALALDAPQESIIHCLDNLKQENLIQTISRGPTLFYSFKGNATPEHDPS